MTNQIQLSEQDKVVFAEMVTKMATMSAEGQLAVGAILSQSYANQTNNTNQGGNNMNNININTDNTSIPTATLTEMVNELNTLRAMVNAQSTAQAVPPTVEPQNTARVQEIEQELAKLQLIVEHNAQAGIPLDKLTSAKYDALLKEYKALMGIDFATRMQGAVGEGLEKAKNFADSIGAFGQRKIAKELIPNSINNTTGFIADLISIAGTTVVGLGEVLQTAVGATTTIASSVLNVGAGTITKVGQATGTVAENVAYNTFGLLRK